ncbi:MAG: EamA family transporter [Parachlamydiales bacterium]|nr:EamA family transporter [Parachlamydiales bacterium]
MKPLHFLLVLLVVAVWGFNFVFVKVGLDALPPMLLCAARFIPVSLPAIFFFKRPGVPFRWVILYTLIMFIFQFTLMFTGMKAGVTAGLGSLLLQIQVFFSLFFAKVLLKEAINRWQVFGALVSFSGIFLVGWKIDAGATFFGFLLVIASAMAWGLGSVIVKKMGKVQSSSLLVWSSFLAWPPLLLFSLLFENSSTTVLHAHELSATAYGAILFIALGSTAFGFGVWNHLVQIYPLATVAPFTLLVPVFGILGSVIFLGENLESWKILAGILVVSGLCLNLAGARQKEFAKERNLQ